MKKLAWILAAIPAAVFAMGANCSGSNVQQCTTTADCTEAGTVCTDGTCQTPECTETAQCVVDDAGASDTCSKDSDCTAGCHDDAGNTFTCSCLVGTSGNNHCVTDLSAGDQPCDQQTPAATEFTGKDAEDGSDVSFCDNTSVTCSNNKCG